MFSEPKWYLSPDSEPLTGIYRVIGSCDLFCNTSGKLMTHYALSNLYGSLEAVFMWEHPNQKELPSGTIVEIDGRKISNIENGSYAVITQIREVLAASKIETALLSEFYLTDTTKPWAFKLQRRICEFTTPVLREFLRTILTDHFLVAAFLTQPQDNKQGVGQVGKLFVKSMAVAEQAFKNAEQLKRHQQEIAFVLGLFHDIGKTQLTPNYLPKGLSNPKKSQFRSLSVISKFLPMLQDETELKECIKTFYSRLMNPKARAEQFGPLHDAVFTAIDEVELKQQHEQQRVTQLTQKINQSILELRNRPDRAF